MENNKPTAILGNPGTGKTNLMIFLAKQSLKTKKYLLGYPSSIEGFINLNDLRDLSRIHDCVVCVDELDEIIPFYDKRSNDSLRRLLKFTEHNNIELIFTTQLSQFVTKMVSALVPRWAITQIDIFELKNGSKPKRILLEYIKCPKHINKEVGMSLPIGQYVWYNDSAQPGENGIFEFPNQDIDKAWKNSERNNDNKMPNNAN